MNRRNFIKSASGLLVPAAASAQSYLPHRRKAFRSSGDLTTSLVAHYQLNEASGNAIAAVGPNMTQVGTVGAGSGGTANSRGTYSSANHFSVTDAVFQLNSGDWTIMGWFNLNSAAATQMLIAQNQVVGGKGFGVYAYVNGGSNSRVYISASNTVAADFYAIAPGSVVSTAAWHFVIGTYNASTKVVTCSLDLGTDGTATLTGTANVPTTVPTQIGRQDYAGFENTMDGFAAKVRVFSGRIIANNSADAAYAYNGGTFSTAP